MRRLLIRSWDDGVVLLLRIGRRRAPIPTLAEFLQIEFTARSGGLDLRPSVYEVGPAEVVRAYAEHAASCLQNPPRGTRNWDVGDAGGTVVASRGETKFSFTRNAHRELAFSDEDSLSRFVQKIFEEARDRGRHDVSRAELQTHVRACRERCEPEWLSFLASPDCSEAWRTFAGWTLPR